MFKHMFWCSGMAAGLLRSLRFLLSGGLDDPWVLEATRNSPGESTRNSPCDTAWRWLP